jgi:hypothetical protein
MTMHELTFATAMDLAFDGVDLEVDFLAWRRDDQIDYDEPPQFIIGEAKSGGKGPLIKARVLAQLKTVATKLPGTTIVIAVLRDHFLPSEKRLLKTFVRWCRRVDSDGEPTNPVVLLTSLELLFDHHVSETWKSLGDPHVKFSNYEHTRYQYVDFGLGPRPEGRGDIARDERVGELRSVRGFRQHTFNIDRHTRTH